MLILQELKEAYEREVEEIVERGVVSNVAKEDFRYHAGQARLARQMLKRVNEAVKSVANQ